MSPHGNHFSCSLSAVMIGRLRDHGGDAAVRRLLEESGSPRTVEYLLDTGNWISYAEATALWRAGARVTRHPDFARAVGEEAGRRLNASPVAALLRSLGSPEEVYRRIADSSSRFSTVARLEAIDVDRGRAVIEATAVDGFPRDGEHCGWTRGLLTQPTVLFGFPPARIAHSDCAALGAPACRYEIEWDTGDATSASSAHADALQYQLDAMRERLAGVFAAAADLISADDLAGVLARITDRAAVEVRAPRYLLAVRTEGLHCHYKGFSEAAAHELAERLLADPAAAASESCLAVPVRSSRKDYGQLLAQQDGGRRFFDHERMVLEVYGRYAAAALDSATALAEAKRRHEQASALLRLARTLASAGTSGEVARRLVDAVPDVVDCDRVCIYLWDGEHIVRRAADDAEGGDDAFSVVPRPGGAIDRLIRDPRPEPLFVTPEAGDPGLRRFAASLGTLATILVPLISRDSFLGLLTVAVRSGAERLEATPDLLDRLSGVAAQATTALENGRLLDQITHQALHDSLTGLANRARLTERVQQLVTVARRDRRTCTLLYIDLDDFKPVNDELGHDAGDRLLIAVGARLSRCTRGGDVVGRLGGDEFAIVLDPSAPQPPPEAFTQRIRDLLAEPFEIDGRPVHVRASIGHATFPHQAGDAAELLRAADSAMFACKRARR